MNEFKHKTKCNCMCSSKTHGTGLPNSISRAIHTDLFMDWYNICVEVGTFSTQNRPRSRTEFNTEDLNKQMIIHLKLNPSYLTSPKSKYLSYWQLKEIIDQIFRGGITNESSKTQVI